ncbi:hypothetical protein Bbelb_265240 [Branchiostoma belcheri]|nr:hypothetical protein Bbelb_265240 [Branchiostoma belcheri]
MSSSSTLDMAVVTGKIGTLDIIAIVCGSLILVVLVLVFVFEAVCGPKEDKGKTNKIRLRPWMGTRISVSKEMGTRLRGTVLLKTAYLCNKERRTLQRHSNAWSTYGQQEQWREQQHLCMCKIIESFER